MGSLEASGPGVCYPKDKPQTGDNDGLVGKLPSRKNGETEER